MKYLAFVLLTSTIYANTCSEPCDFIRGDFNGDGSVNLTDIIAVQLYLFQGGNPPDNFDAADMNDDGFINVSDGVYLQTYLFLGGAALPKPYPESGFDCTPDSLASDCDSVPSEGMLFYMLSSYTEVWAFNEPGENFRFFDNTFLPDHPVFGPQPEDKGKIRLGVSNEGTMTTQCDHEEAREEFRPWWLFNGLDVQPFTLRAIDSGSIKLEWAIRIAANFHATAIYPNNGGCLISCIPTCSENDQRTNQLSVDVNSGSVAFTFTDGFGAEIIEVSVPVAGELLFRYKVRKRIFCCIETTDEPGQSLIISSTHYVNAIRDALCASGIAEDTKLYLKKIQLHGLRYNFKRNGNADIALEEYIFPDKIYNYSVRLEKFNILGCVEN